MKKLTILIFLITMGFFAHSQTNEFGNIKVHRNFILGDDTLIAVKDAIIDGDIHHIITGNAVYDFVTQGGQNPVVFEKELTNGENDINVGFTLQSTSLIFFNGDILRNVKWSGEGTQILNLSLTTKQYDNITVKN